MNEERQKRLLGLICTVIGGAFVLAGIVIFIMSNHMNFQMKKTEANVVAMYKLETIEGEQHTMTQLSYRVGTELVFASYEYPGILSEDTQTIEIFYSIKNPTMVFDGDWMWQPLLVLVLGLPILVTGLYYWGIIKLEAWKLRAPDVNAGSAQKELYKAKKNVVENILPMLAGILFVTFGIIMLVTRGEWWAWMFIIIGVIELLYIGLEFVPALITWIHFSKVDKLKQKVKVYDVEMEEDLDESTSEVKKQSELDEDDLAPFEIKSSKSVKAKTTGNNRKKKKK